MANTSKLLSLMLLVSLLFSSTISMISARKLVPKSTLLKRLKLDEEAGPSSCWDALFELRSCSGELVLFFLNGETNLGPNCCSAVRTIEHQCWPSMMGTLGITVEEGDILRGYCDGAEHGGSSSTTTTTTPPPASVHQCYNLPRLIP